MLLSLAVASAKLPGAKPRQVTGRHPSWFSPQQSVNLYTPKVAHFLSEHKNKPVEAQMDLKFPASLQGFASYEGVTERIKEQKFGGKASDILCMLSSLKRHLSEGSPQKPSGLFSFNAQVQHTSSPVKQLERHYCISPWED